MQERTAQLVKEIGEVVRNEWPNVHREARLDVVLEYLQCGTFTSGKGNTISIDSDPDDIPLGDPLMPELIMLDRDGTLGIFYLKDDRPAMMLELLQRKTIQVTKVYTVEIPVVGTEVAATLYGLTEHYNLNHQETQYEVINNES